MQTVPHSDWAIICNYNACSSLLTSAVIQCMPTGTVQWNNHLLSIYWRVPHPHPHPRWPHLSQVMKPDPDLTLWGPFVPFSVFGLRVSPDREAALSMRQQQAYGRRWRETLPSSHFFSSTYSGGFRLQTHRGTSTHTVFLSLFLDHFRVTMFPFGIKFRTTCSHCTAFYL